MTKRIDIEYLWDGSWDSPGNGEYVIMENGHELEPCEVIEYLNRLQEYMAQDGTKLSARLDKIP
jgi:hypothetical protein